MSIEMLKNLSGIIAIILVFVGYAPYFFDIWKGKTKPHIFSWLVWGITTLIIFSLQISAGAGFGAYVTIIVAIISFTIFFLGLKNGEKDIKKIDVAFLFLALVAIPLWLVAKQPVISIIILSTIEMLGFAPTIRKSWNNPYSETISFYAITIIRHALSIIALAKINIITILFPATWVTANLLFFIMLVFRRKLFHETNVSSRQKIS